jgi:alkylation response protein AidB-like acyl-CoA dehydrogenase
MDFKLSEEQEAIKKMVRDFTVKEIAPVAAAIDETERFPGEIFKKLNALGLANLTVPEAYGGAGIDTLTAAAVIEELACGCAGVAASVIGHAVALHPLICAGTGPQKEKYLPLICTQGKLVSFALKEREAGSNLAALAACYGRDGDNYVLNGAKAFINNAAYADYLVVFAASGGEENKKVSAFTVDCRSPGVTIEKTEKKLGLRAVNTAKISFKNVRVPAGDRVGEEGDGMALSAQASDLARVLAGAAGVGLARAAMAEAVKYARERVQFGKPIAANQAIQFMLAEMAAGIEAAKLLVYQAAWLLDQGFPCTGQSAMAKLVATEAAMRIATDAVQVLGGYGYSREYPVEKYMRDAKTLQLFEGGGFAQRALIAGGLFNL